MQCLRIALIIVAAFASSAYAQERGLSPGEIEVSVSFSLSVPTKGGDLQNQKEALEQGRRTLYDIAANECANLLATIASSCGLRRLNVQSMSQRALTQESAQLTANASYMVS